MNPSDDMMRQVAPFPHALNDLVDTVSYKEGFRFRLQHLDRGQGSEGLTLIVTVFGKDTYHPDTVRGVNHYFIVPAASYNEQNWRRWLFDRVLDIETHEACEWFMIDGERPYSPLHSPGNDPYFIRELATDEERRTDFRGVYHPPAGLGMS